MQYIWNWVWKPFGLFLFLIFYSRGDLFATLPELTGDSLVRKRIEKLANDSLQKQLGFINQELNRFVKIQLGIQRRDKPILVDRIYSSLEGQFINISMIIPVEAYNSRMDRLIKLGARWRHHVDLENRFNIFANLSVSVLSGKGFASQSKLKFYFGKGSMVREMYWTFDFETYLKNEVRHSLEDLMQDLEVFISENPILGNIVLGIPGMEMVVFPEEISEIGLGQVPKSELPEFTEPVKNFSIAGVWYFEVDMHPYNGKYGKFRVKVVLELIEEDYSLRVNGKVKNPKGKFFSSESYKEEMQRVVFRELHKYSIKKIEWHLWKGKNNSPYYLQIISDDLTRNDSFEIHPLGENKMIITAWTYKRKFNESKGTFNDAKLNKVDIIARKKK